MLYQNGTISIKEILDSLPHKFKNGKNVRIIFEAYLKQYNKIMETYVKAMNGFGLAGATGDQLDKIGNNFSIHRNAMSDRWRTRARGKGRHCVRSTHNGAFAGNFPDCVDSASTTKNAMTEGCP